MNLPLPTYLRFLSLKESEALEQNHCHRTTPDHSNPIQSTSVVDHTSICIASPRRDFFYTLLTQHLLLMLL